MSQALLNWFAGVFGSLGVIATLAYAWSWIGAFFSKQRELNALDVEARNALLTASSAWKETAAAEKHRREVEKDQLGAELDLMRSQFSRLQQDLSTTRDLKEREEVLVDFVTRHTAEHVSSIVRDHGGEKRSRDLLLQMLAFAASRSLSDEMKPLLVAAVKLGDEEIRLTTKCLFLVWFARFLVQELHRTPTPAFDAAMSAALDQAMTTDLRALAASVTSP